MKLTTAAFAVAFALPPTTTNASCLDEVRVFAKDICESISTSGSSSKKETTAEIKAEIDGFAKRIVGSAGGAISEKTVSEKYDNVVREKLGDLILDTSKCRQEMVKIGIAQVCRPQSMLTPKPCRRPAAARPETREETVEQFSGWKAPGGSRESWCNELISKTIQERSVGPDHRTEIVDSKEHTRWHPIFMRQRQYFCRINVSWTLPSSERPGGRCE